MYYRISVIELAVPALAIAPTTCCRYRAQIFRARAGRGGSRPAAERALLNYTAGQESPRAGTGCSEPVWSPPARRLDQRGPSASRFHLRRRRGSPRVEGGPHHTPGSSTSERDALSDVLSVHGGSVSRAAEALGLWQALYRRMERLGVSLERRPRS